MPQTDIMKKNMPLKEWLPLLGMTFSAFVNTSEFMPIGLLTNIAADFGITEAHAGLLISVYAWVVMLLSLPLMLLVCRMEMRKLLLCTLALFGVCQILSTVSGSFGALMASRIGVACSHAVFWSIASPIAVRVVSEEHRPLALSMIVTGSSVAMIFGLPLGRAIGLHIGWRMTFLCVGLLAFAIFAYLLKVAPRLPSRQTFTLRELPRLLRNPLLLGIYWLAALVATAYYTAYSYIEPFLKQVAQLPESWITMTLALFGVSGILGSFLFSWLYSRFPHTFIKLSLGGIAGALLLLYPASFQTGAVGSGGDGVQHRLPGGDHQAYAAGGDGGRDVDLLRHLQSRDRLRNAARRSRLHLLLHFPHRIRGRPGRRRSFLLLYAPAAEAAESVEAPPPGPAGTGRFSRFFHYRS